MNWIPLLLLLSLFTSPYRTDTPPKDPIQVQLLTINDYHGKLNQTYKFSNPPNQKAGRADYLSTYFQAYENPNAHTIKVQAGDVIGASAPVSALFHDEPTVEIFNYLGFSYGTVGNHEFDKGVLELLRMVYGGNELTRENQQPYPGIAWETLCANCIWKETGQTLFPPFAVTEIEGVKLGFIGVITQDTEDLVAKGGVEGLYFSDPTAEVNKAVKELKKQGVRAIVILAHMPATQDGNVVTGQAADLATGVDDEVDVILAAHNHQVVNGTVDNKLIVQALNYGKAFGDIELLLDPLTGDVLEKSAEVIYVDQAKIKPDPVVTKMIQSYEGASSEVLDQVVGQAAEDIVGGSLGNFIADGMKQVMDSDFALVNSGGIRDSIKKGKVTYEDILAIHPFQNNLVKLTVTGKELQEILNAQITPNKGPDFSVAGFTYTWNNKTKKVESILLNEGTRIKPDRSYTIAVNSFMADSDAPMFQLIGKYGKDKTIGPTDTEALAEFISSFPQPITYSTDDRIQVVSK
ncbi:bifunctional metallophosphatase/5'-nucleotidase [Mangrovibacillus cuniculi]|uniref:Bifunctional metallophosphatase/5'-nucleotidase n=1 Tax=Mangrovibacillus cuniculi TaxID=2593652 RepID=A0A7S8CCK8_9BACI|nr:bifunctional metallophosphatase/5'-nucleotidase [Mangrovibacillus cuniculi]QPC47505.1 bifunctional metallophosphatase/5'-nucleotidase [Mangrovibacillus cuniculi]